MQKSQPFLLAACFALLATATGNGEDAPRSVREYKVHQGLRYPTAEPRLKLDLYVPLDAAEPMPCVVVIQGGGFKPQTGQRFRPMAEHLAEHGFAAALISYRGRPKHTYRETMADVEAAVRFIREISDEYGIDPDRIGAMGRSAGATLAVLLAVTPEKNEGRQAGNDEPYPARIQAAVGIAGVYDFVGRFVDREQIAIQPNLDTKLVTNGEWIGSTYAPTDKDWLRASAINHVDAEDPPILLLHSKNDRTVPWQQSQRMHAELAKAGGSAELEISDNGGHSGPRNSKTKMVAFFEKMLGERGSSPAPVE
ncbi:alpha/beta hydrolase [Stratiformator vulcanicus]|uniref:Carboxylesterase NlhH n=1 Tax=Stratiformator vulcanicus TaxID=2527980 RepID=A0A517R6J0_9PLAN|nr:alpha/beta hydrolase [Stratiformator vulcanicus]QDT39498.1 Carboxylesterase NlhH [Stratiformator vulcanicus]